MALQLDLEEQEKLDQLKHFWARFGNLISWTLIAVLGAYAAWTGYNYWQRQQATQAAVQFDALERAVEAADVVNIKQSFAQLKDQYGSTVIAQQGALIAAKALFDKEQMDDAKAALQFAADSQAEPGYQAIAKLRLAAVQASAKQYDEAIKVLDGLTAQAFLPLAQDRKADILVLQSKADEAKALYEKAYTGLQADDPYRNIVAFKWRSVGGIPPEAAVADAEVGADVGTTAAAQPAPASSADAPAQPAVAEPVAQKATP